MKSEEDGWRRFLGLCRRTRSEEELDALFEVILTPTERREIAGRTLIVKELLLRKKTQREIADALSVSIAIVTRGSNALKTVKPELRRFLKS